MTMEQKHIMTNLRENLLYHYTSKEAFFSMTKIMLEAKSLIRQFEFWASSCFCMNDTVELKQGYGILMELLKEEEKKHEPHLRLSNICSEVKIKDMTDEQIPSFIRDNSFNMERAPYAISFSSKPEQIPLWSMYGDNGKGVCLCFDLNRFSESDKLLCFPVIYDFESTNDEDKNMIRRVIQDQLQKYYEEIEQVSDAEELFYKKNTCLRVLATFLSPFFKHNSFSFENEWRLIRYCSTHEVEYRKNNNGSIIPYVKINIPFCALKKVIVGPCSNSKTDMDLIHAYMKLCNPQQLVKIEPSSVPFRMI